MAAPAAAPPANHIAEQPVRTVELNRVNMSSMAKNMLLFTVYSFLYVVAPRINPTNKMAMKKNKNKPNRICAMDAAAPAIPLKPKIPVIMAIIKNVSAQLNMFNTSLFLNVKY